MLMKITRLLLNLILAFIISAAQTPSPRTAEQYNDRGLERQNKGETEAAIEDFSKAISLRPPALLLAAVYYNRANARLSKNDLEGAVADYSKAIEI